MRNENEFDVVIIGGGAAGLMAAWEIVKVGKNVAIVEARDRIGGRIVTIKDQQFDEPIELCAEFIHGNLELTKQLLQKGGIKFHKVEGSIWRHRKGKLQEEKDFIKDYSRLKNAFSQLTQDISVAEFIEVYLGKADDQETRTALKSYVEGYYAADINKASTFALRDELEKGDDVQFRIDGGYKKIIDFLEGEISGKGSHIFLNKVVTEIIWHKGKVEIITPAKKFIASKVLVTVPVGVLQSGMIKFDPELEGKMNAIKILGFGPVIKIIFQFSEAIWKNKELTQQKYLSDLRFLFSEEIIPTWWTQFPKNTPILTGWVSGLHAEKLMCENDDTIMQHAVSSLSNIFQLKVSELKQKIRGWKVINWATDRYNLGGYSFETIGGKEAKQMISEPIGNTIYFAGEGLHKGPEIGTVEAALYTGKEMGYRMIADGFV
jgi:monoamine oxidase